MKKIITFLARLGFWPYIILFTTLAVIISEILTLAQSYWLTGEFFDKNLLIAGFITPLIDGFIVFLLSAFLIRYLIIIQNDLEITTAELQKSHKQLEAAQSISGLGFWELDIKEDKLYWSDEVYRIFDLEPQSIPATYEAFLSFIHPDDIKAVNRAYQQSLDSKQDYEVIHRIITKSGAVKHVHERGRHDYDTNNHIVRTIGTVHNITENRVLFNALKEQQEKLLASKEQAEKLLQEQKDLLSLFDKSDAVLFKWNNDEQWSVSYVSENISKLLEYSTDDFLSNTISYSSCIHKDDLEHVSKEVSNAVEHGLDFFKHDPYRIITKNGHMKWIMEYTVIQKDTSGSPTHFIGYIADVTEERERDQELKNKLQRFIDAQNNIVILTDGKKLTFSNKAFLNFFGYESLKAFQKDYDCICDRFIEQSNFFHLGLVKENESSWIESLLNRSGRARVVSMLDKNMTPYAFSVSVNEYDDESHIVSFTDISDSMIEKLELTKEATIDALTDVYNRVYFNKNINSILELHKNHKMKTGIIFFDIDHFKKVNDTYGHATGDYVLNQIALLVKKNTRASDTIIRWGGEEFVIICEIDEDKYLHQIAEHLRSVIETYKLKDISSLTCSFGCEIHNDENKILTTMNKADAKLYIAKESGRNRVVS